MKKCVAYKKACTQLTFTCSTSTIETMENVVFIFNFEHILHHLSIAEFEQVNVNWVLFNYKIIVQLVIRIYFSKIKSSTFPIFPYVLWKYEDEFVVNFRIIFVLLKWFQLWEKWYKKSFYVLPSKTWRCFLTIWYVNICEKY